MLVNLRMSVFWIIDFLKGRKIAKSYADIKRVYYQDSYSKKMINNRERKIRRLINESIKNTEFYKGYSLEKGIEQFPVINKKVIRESQEMFLSTKFKKSELYQMSTSGSTGTPFTSYQNEEKKRRVNAEAIFFNGLAGYHVGDKLIHLRSLNLKNKKSRLQQFLQNERLVDVKMLDDESIKTMLNEIQNHSYKKAITLLSYASTYDAIAQYLHKNHEKDLSILSKAKIGGVISTSEILTDETRIKLSSILNTNCYSRYANMENGMLGQDTLDHFNTFIINEANYFIEILKLYEDKPVEEGEVGRIVVTDLYNYAMPMLRYDTGDIGSVTTVKVNNINKKAITNFGGRQIDMIYDVNDIVVSPHKISVSFWGIQELKEFQFIQVDKGKYEILVVLSDEFVSEKILRDKLLEILGKEASIQFKAISSIPTLKSGKRKYIMNKM